MNNFEKRFFLECFEKLLPKMSISKGSFDELLDLYIEEFNVNKNLFKNFYDEGYFNTRILRTSKNKSDLIKIIKFQISQQLKKIKSQKSLFESQLSFLKDIFNLSDKEYNIFLLLTLKETNELFEKLFDCYGRFEMLSVIDKVLKISIEERTKLLDEMRFKSLIEGRRHDIEINDYWFGILNNNKYNTKD